MTKRLWIYIMNVIVIALCAVSMSAYFFKPFLGIKATITLKQDMISGMIGSDAEGSALGGIDFNAVLGDQGFSFDVELAIEPQPLFKSFSLSAEEVKAYLENDIIAPNIQKIVESLTAPIGDLIGGLIKEAAKAAVIQSLGVEMGNLSEEDQEKINNAIDNIYQKFEEQASVDDFSSTVIDEIGNLSMIEGAETLTEEEKEDLKKELSDALSGLGLVDENGNIADTDAAIAALMEMATGSLGGSDESGEPEGGEPEGGEPEGGEPEGGKEASLRVGLYDDGVTVRFPSGVAVAYADGEENPAVEVKDELKKKITDAIMGAVNLTPQMAKIISWVFKGLAIFIIILMATWAWLILKIVFRIFRKNPAIKLWVPIVLGWGPALLCFIVNYGFDPLMNKFGESLGQFKDLFRISLSSSAKVAFFCAVGLFALSIPYSAVRKALKKEIREKKREKRGE